MFLDLRVADVVPETTARIVKLAEEKLEVIFQREFLKLPAVSMPSFTPRFSASRQNFVAAFQRRARRLFPFGLRGWGGLGAGAFRILGVFFSIRSSMAPSFSGVIFIPCCRGAARCRGLDALGEFKGL